MKALTVCERKVFDELGRGLTVKQIATAFNVSFKTIKTHCDNIRKKLEINSMHALIVQAVLSAKSESSRQKADRQNENAAV